MVVKMECAHCLGADLVVTKGVKMESSRTMYPFDGTPGSPEDPNKPIPLCRACASDHHTHWDEMWAHVRAGNI